MFAAQWLVDGHDSPLLRELASLTPRQALEGEVRLADVLAELGCPVRQVDSPYEEIPWRGQWEGIAFACTLIGPGQVRIPGHDVLEPAGALLLGTLHDQLQVYRYVVAERRLHVAASYSRIVGATRSVSSSRTRAI
jgi:hypothetical protein